MHRPVRRLAVVIAGLVLLGGCTTRVSLGSDITRTNSTRPTHRVIVFVWDGLRPDSINTGDTPHLAALAQRGSYFADNHSSYPTFTMMNAAAFATGAFSGSSGFYGNRLYRPGPSARNGEGKPVSLQAPVFTEDYGVLRQLDSNDDGHLLQVDTLLQAAQKAGLRTAVVGKSGPAFLQDYKMEASASTRKRCSRWPSRANCRTRTLRCPRRRVLPTPRTSSVWPPKTAIRPLRLRWSTLPTVSRLTQATTAALRRRQPMPI